MTIYYVDAVAGSDSNDGLSDSYPWKTSTKVNGFGFTAGDVIRFKTGNYGAINVLNTGNLTYNQYGDGPKPLLTNGGEALLIKKSDITVESLAIQSTITSAIYGLGESAARLTGCVIRDCEIPQSAQTGVRMLYCDDWIIEDCSISDVWNGSPYPGGLGTGIYPIYCDRPIIRRNYIKNCFLGYLSLDVRDGVVYNNVFDKCMVNCLGHGGGFAANPEIFINNTILHHPAYTSGHGMEAQNADPGLIARNNLIYCTYDSGAEDNVQCVTIDTGQSGIVLSNNLYFVNGSAAIGKVGATIYSTMNEYLTAIRSAYPGSEEDSINYDPILLSDGKLKKQSPALDAGILVSGYTDTGTDLWGNSYKLVPNIGAYWGDGESTGSKLLNVGLIEGVWLY